MQSVSFHQFNPFTFKVITFVILLLVFYMPYIFFVLHFFCYCLLCLVVFAVKCLNCSHSFCLYSLAIFFMITMGNTINMLKLQHSSLNLYQLNFNNILNFCSFHDSTLIPFPYCYKIASLYIVSKNINNSFTCILLNYTENKMWSYKPKLQ